MSSEQFKNLIDSAGNVICFNKIIEHLKQQLEEPADTPDEVQSNLWLIEAYKLTMAMRMAEYKRLRKVFGPNDMFVEVLDNLLKEYGVDHETA